MPDKINLKDQGQVFHLKKALFHARKVLELEKDATVRRCFEERVKEFERELARLR